MAYSNKKEMIENQLIARGITNKNLIEAFDKVDRKNFVLKEDIKYAYYDSALPIGYNQTISQPYIVALMIELLDCKKEDIVLEIGAGSGYACAIVSFLSKKVIGYEIIEELCKFAKDNIKKSKIENVEIILGDGTQIKEKEFYDKIIISAATKNISLNLINALKEGGVLVVPQGDLEFQILNVYKKIGNNLILINKTIPVRFVPLRGKGGLI